MANDCRPQIQACALLVARLDADGAPQVGASNYYVSDALVSLGWTAELKEGEEIEITNACGANLVSYKDCDRLKWLNIEMSLGTPDPELSELLVGGTRLTDGAAVGYAFPPLNLATCPNGVGLELWSKRVLPGGGLDPTFPYARWILPRVYLQWNEATFENGPFQPTVQGFAIENLNYEDGPLNDIDVATTRVAQWIPVEDIPTTQCGYQTSVAS